METNKIDKIVRDSLQSRTIQPSNSAWERLSDQLDSVEQTKRINWFKYTGYAAAVLLLISVAFFMNRPNGVDPIVPEEIVLEQIDTTDLVKPTFNNTVPVETVIVKTDEVKETPVISNGGTTEKSHKKKTVVAKKKSLEMKVPEIIKEQSKTVVADNTPVIKEETTKIKTEIPDGKTKITTPSRITIDADALLYAVNNPNKDINEYYAKYDVNREEVLKTIQKELKRMDLKIDANSILVDVEKSIDEDTFKRSFMNVVKGKITGLASAFANRNN